MIIDTPDFESHIDIAFFRFRAHSPKVKAQKSKLFQERILFIEHFVSAYCFEANTKQTDLIKVKR